jgi:hypothetical protein
MYVILFPVLERLWRLDAIAAMLLLDFPCLVSVGYTHHYKQVTKTQVEHSRFVHDLSCCELSCT